MDDFDYTHSAHGYFDILKNNGRSRLLPSGTFENETIVGQRESGWIRDTRLAPQERRPPVSFTSKLRRCLPVLAAAGPISTREVGRAHNSLRFLFRSQPKPGN